MEKELKIEVPQGYEIDRQKSTFEKIIFKKITEKPKTWEDYCSTGMKVTIQIKYSNYLLARTELVMQEEDDKSKIAVVVAADKARDATTYIGRQLSDSQQVQLAKVAIKKRFNKLIK